ncbi:putative damage-inducible protein DinB [Micromonospora sp. A200]|uniref:DinB family protein n=1 Tax=Micromonospora sp. A200 TaxID=2940568 RepID=UPI002473DEA3|nr:DinB family protein [Micromonospora sp. A200]MDH6465044.1 putative damage-inducible protein DinB [Micromonospora sp. A200]
MTTARPLDSEELASTASEREVLEAFIDAYQDVIIARLRGLSADDARRRLVPSLTTLIGLIKHAAAVERNWFQQCLAQQLREQVAGNSFGDDASWQAGSDETVANVIAEYVTACDRSRQSAAGFALDDTVPHSRLGRVWLRYIYVHIIRELARHCRHADILREQVDGVTGH